MLLNFDQVGHFRDFADMAKEFANTLTAGERLRQMMSHVGFSHLVKTAISERKFACPHPARTLEGWDLLKSLRRGEIAAKRLAEKAQTTFQQRIDGPVVSTDRRLWKSRSHRRSA